MAKIYEARIDHDVLEGIEVSPPLATGSLTDAVQVARAGLAADATSDTATN